MLAFSFLIVAWLVLLAIFLWDLIQHGADKVWMFIIIPANASILYTNSVSSDS